MQLRNASIQVTEATVEAFAREMTELAADNSRMEALASAAQVAARRLFPEDNGTRAAMIMRCLASFFFSATAHDS